MPGGYTGNILVLDLKNQSFKIEDTNIEDARQFIGGKGLGAKYLIDNLPKGTDPLSPKNILIIATGPLTATKAQTSGRGVVVTKSPLTNLFVDSHFGGTFAAELKKAGWDFLVIKEKSKDLIYIVIKNDKVEFREASKLAGKECLETHNFLKEKEGKNVKTAVIGPAGENLVKIACITFDGHRHAGRAGTGAVMGSKNVKAIVVSGNKKIKLHNEEAFNEKAKEVLEKIQQNSFIPIRRKYGTPYWVKVVNDAGFLPTRNFSEGYFEYGKEIDAEAMQERIVDSGGSCYNCIIACWNRSSIKKGPFRGTTLVGPEYETIALMGSNLGLCSIEDVAYVCHRCNELGMDTISMGGLLGFIIEAYNRGIIKKEDINGLEIGWGKANELAKLMELVAHRKNELAIIIGEGIKAISEKLNAIDFAVHCKGLDMPGYDPRGSFGIALAYATSDRGACHQRAWTVRAELNDPELNRFSFNKKAKIVKEVQDERAAFFSLVLCDFAPISEENCVEMWNLATGFDHTVESYLKCGERIWNLVRIFNLRENPNIEPDRLPPRIIKEAFTRGQSKGIIIKEEEFERCLQEYYSLRGWDNRGIPKIEKLEELGLKEYSKYVR